ncbi:MAG TPA: hypothetical protein VGN37_30550 [Actinocatenispora sp.]
MAPRDSADDLRRAFRNITTQWDQLIDRYNGIVDAIEGLGLPASPLRELASYYLKDPMRTLHTELTRASETIRRIGEHDTPILSLVLASGSWYEIERAAATVHREAEPTTRGDANDDLADWHGKAATGYHTRVRNQVSAVSEVASLAGYAGGWLDAVATANLAFLAKISVIIGDAAKLATAIAADIVDVVGIPAAAGKIGELCGALVGRLLPDAAFAVLDQMLSNVTSEHDLAHARNQRELVLGGSWPQAVRG